jgi:hypothetical protein
MHSPYVHRVVRVRRCPDRWAERPRRRTGSDEFDWIAPPPKADSPGRDGWRRGRPNRRHGGSHASDLRLPGRGSDPGPGRGRAAGPGRRADHGAGLDRPADRPGHARPAAVRPAAAGGQRIQGDAAAQSVPEARAAGGRGPRLSSRRPASGARSIPAAWAVGARGPGPPPRRAAPGAPSVPEARAAGAGIRRPRSGHPDEFLP